VERNKPLFPPCPSIFLTELIVEVPNRPPSSAQVYPKSPSGSYRASSLSPRFGFWVFGCSLRVFLRFSRLPEKRLSSTPIRQVFVSARITLTRLSPFGLRAAPPPFRMMSDPVLLVYQRAIPLLGYPLNCVLELVQLPGLVSPSPQISRKKRLPLRCPPSQLRVRLCHDLVLFLRKNRLFNITLVGAPVRPPRETSLSIPPSPPNEDSVFVRSRMFLPLCASASYPRHQNSPNIFLGGFYYLKSVLIHSP